MLYTIDPELSSGSSSDSTSSPRLRSRRNALGHVLQGCTVSDLETIYKCTEDITKVIIPLTTVVRDTDEASPPPVAGRRRMRERRGAVSFERVTMLLASGAVSDSESATCNTR